ncbi:Maf family protein [Spectribacter hydrogenoxidans]|uniref:dTTP/UTP pyrophosphatase n=1 Tax=Spectribacter hydrogenoxidans TaxID=3075608 RepID=A0ABU3C3T5_9GAMM|nr:Maf family protein [Salinisphaera sp. W335]MDT0636218.1 Maf family protein [Salinisphaera sp. W335]
MHDRYAADPLIGLASQSLRRSALLDQIGVAHAIIRIAVDEQPVAGEQPDDYVIRLALAKAEAGRRVRPDLPVLGADTAVVIDSRILGKPTDRADALRMLDTLSGRVHEVYTGVALAGTASDHVLSVSRVTLDTIDPARAEAYWASGEPVDKAGAYAIQGLGAVFVRHLAGSYSGVMGLPLAETAELLAGYGIRRP